LSRSALSGVDRQLLRGRFPNGHDRIPRSYFEGASPENGCRPNEPFAAERSDSAARSNRAGTPPRPDRVLPIGVFSSPLGPSLCLRPALPACSGAKGRIRVRFPLRGGSDDCEDGWQGLFAADARPCRRRAEFCRDFRINAKEV